MQLTVKIEISDEQITMLAQKAANEYLKVPDSWRGDSGGTGYQVIAQQVKKVISDIDFTEDIKTTVERIAKGIVEDVTAEQIKKIAKEQVRKMKEDGSLLA